MGEIGKRAAEAVRAMASKNDTHIGFELNCIKMHREQLWQWEHNKCDPSVYRLQQMALNGYDVHYILTGEIKHG